MNSIVVNIRKKELNKRGIKDFSEWVNPESEDNMSNELQDNMNLELSDKKRRIYIGRNMCVYVPGTHASKWANPYPVKKHGLETSLELYEEYIRTSKLINDLSELDNAELGCWCAPNKCHGDILIKLRIETMQKN